MMLSSNESELFLYIPCLDRDLFGTMNLRDNFIIGDMGQLPHSVEVQSDYCDDIGLGRCLAGSEMSNASIQFMRLGLGLEYCSTLFFVASS